MSLWTCIACTARRAVGAPCCPQCGASGYEDGDTVSGDTGVQGAAYVAPAYAQPVVVIPEQRTDPTPEPPAEATAS